jgi:hypothetical protein
MTLPEYDEGDRLRIRGHEYVVDNVDFIPERDAEDRILQYRLDGVDGQPSGILKPEESGPCFVVQEFREVAPDDVDVVSGGEQ